MADVPVNGISWRVAELERRVQRLDSLEPAVMRQEVNSITKDLDQIASDVKSLYRLFVGFVISFAFIVLTALIAVWMSTKGGVSP